MTQRSARASMTASAQAPSGTVIVAAADSSAMRRQSTSRATLGTSGTARASSSSNATGTATLGPYRADRDGAATSADPKPENPRTNPARIAAPAAAAKVHDTT